MFHPEWGPNELRDHSPPRDERREQEIRGGGSGVCSPHMPFVTWHMYGTWHILGVLTVLGDRVRDLRTSSRTYTVQYRTRYTAQYSVGEEYGISTCIQLYGTVLVVRTGTGYRYFTRSRITKAHP